MTYVPVNRHRMPKSRPLVALANLILLLTMPVYGGFIMCYSFILIFVRREDGYKRIVTGEAFLLEGMREMFERPDQ